MRPRISAPEYARLLQVGADHLESDSEPSPVGMTRRKAIAAQTVDKSKEATKSVSSNCSPSWGGIAQLPSHLVKDLGALSPTTLLS